MIEGTPGLDVSALVQGVLAEGPGPGALHGIERLLHGNTRYFEGPPVERDPYARLFGTQTGSAVATAVGNESKTLDALSSLSIELMLEYITKNTAWVRSHSKQRFLAVPGLPTRPPVLLILDPDVTEVSQSRRLTDDVQFDTMRMAAAFDPLRPVMHEVVGERVAGALSEIGPEGAIELMWISQPEVVVTRLPRMVPLCAPSPHLAVHCAAKVSSVGIFCKDPEGDFGVSASYHGTGPVGTPVTVGTVASEVKHADNLQDIVFIPVAAGNLSLPVYARKGVRGRPAPSEAEPVTFDGAGTQKKVTTHIKSHDAGILQNSRTLQFRVQTPADANSGDSGSALVDQDDRVVAFGIERTGFGEFPELTHWVWAANALSALGLTPT
jgi:hypothetical protein